MRKIKIYWIEDKKDFVTGLLKRKIKFILEDLNILPDNGNVDYSEYLNDRDIWIYRGENLEVNFEHTDYVYELEMMAKWANDNDDTIFLIDFNLKDHNGDGLNGDQIIAEIRRHNDCKIIFYSSEATQEELRQKLNNLENLECVARENLLDHFSRHLSEIL